MLKLEIKGKLPSLNSYMNAERSNRYIAADIKKQATEFVWWQVKNSKPQPGLCDYTFTWYVQNKRTDPDNLSFAQKFIFDALVQAKIIPNDSMKYVNSIFHMFLIGEPKVTVEIEPA